jgi:hypothetical protein
MGPQLRSYVEAELLTDLRHYGIDSKDVSFDWSDACQEGHVTEYLDGVLENWSGIVVNGPDGEPVAEGWLEFIHGGPDYPLFVFWEFLHVRVSGQWQPVEDKPGIPLHVWNRLPDRSKELCTKSGSYDATWHTDPLVVSWARSRRSSGRP